MAPTVDFVLVLSPGHFLYYIWSRARRLGLGLGFGPGYVIQCLTIVSFNQHQCPNISIVNESEGCLYVSSLCTFSCCQLAGTGTCAFISKKVQDHWENDSLHLAANAKGLTVDFLGLSQDNGRYSPHCVSISLAHLFNCCNKSFSASHVWCCADRWMNELYFARSTCMCLFVFILPTYTLHREAHIWLSRGQIWQ